MTLDDIRKKLRNFTSYTVPQTLARVASNPTLNKVAQLPQQAASNFRGNVQALSQPDTAQQWMGGFNKTPIGGAARTLTKYYIAPTLQTPYYARMMTAPNSSLEERGIGALGTVGGILGAVPDPTDLAYMGYEFSKGYLKNAQNAQINGNPRSGAIVPSFKAGLRSLTGEEDATLAEALGQKGKVGDVLNMAEFPLLIAAGVAKSKFDSKKMLQLAPELKEVRSLLSGYDFFKPADQIRTLEKAAEILPKIGHKPTKELQKLMIQSPQEYINYARGLVEDALYSIGHPHENLGMSTRELKTQPTQASKGVNDIKMDQPVKTATQLTLRPKQVPENIPTAGLISSQPQIDKPLQTAGAETINRLQGGKNTVSTVKDWAYKIQDKLYTEFIDRFHPMSKLAGMANKSDSLKRNLAKYYGSGSTADYHLQEELSPILRGSNIDDLRDASVAMRDIELNNRGIQGSPNQVDAIKTLEKLKEKYGDAGMKNLRTKLEQLYEYQDKIAKQYLVDTGIMSQANYNKMRMDNNFYVPFKRVMDNVDEFLGIPVKKGAGSVGSQNVVFKIKGSDKEIIDPIQSIVENTYKIVSLGQRQKVARVIADISNDLPELVHRTNMSDARNTIVLFENGKKVHYSVPQEVAEAARGLSEESLVTLTKVLKIPTDLFRTMTTGVNPEFLMPNVARDVQSAMFNTGINPLKWIAGLAHYAKKDQIYKDFLREGGRTARVSLNRPFIVRTAKELAGQGFTVKSPKDIIRGLEMLSEYSEQPTRIAVFKDAYEKAVRSGLSKEDALADAAYWAQEGTVNFARRGSKMTNINAIYAYLNARMQGIDRMARTAKNNPTGAAARFGFGLLAPSLALYAWNSSNPKYYDERFISQRDKQDNFIFMLPQPVNGVEYLKIPKAEVGKIVNPVEAFFDWSRNKGGDVWQSIGSVIKSFSPIDNWGGIIPTAINPLVENAFNKDFYTGYDLVPDYKKNYPPAYQSSSYTSPLFRMVGEKLNMSPALIQNLAESYGGGMMRILEMGTQPFIDKKYVSAKNEQGAAINRTPVLRRFMGGEKKTEQEQIKADISKQKAAEYDINEIKGGINRGDIPVDVGIQKIQELRGNAIQTIGNPQTGGGYDLGESVMYQDATTGKWKEVQKVDMEKEIKDAEYSLESDRLQRDDDWQGWVANTTDYVSTLLDYQSKLDPVYDKAESLRIQNKIEDLIVKVEKYKSYGGFKKPKKPKKVTIKFTKAPSVKINIPKRTSFKIKQPKLTKLTSRKFSIKA